MMTIESAGLTDIGRSRGANEDSLLCDDGLKLYVVADGMGGHRGGAMASRMVIEAMRESMAEYAASASVDSRDLIDPDLSLPANRLLQSIYQANSKVKKVSAEDEACRGMGSTVSAALFSNGRAIVANVGDSPIWLVHNGRIEMLSVAHTLLAEQMAIDPRGADRLGPGLKHVLTRAIGVHPRVKVDISEVQCFAEDAIVLGSDGLSNKVQPAEVLEVVERCAPREACRVLVDLANSRGGEDNITAVIARVKSVGCEGGSVMKCIKRLWKKHI